MMPSWRLWHSGWRSDTISYMTPFLTSLLFSVGFGCWLFTKLQNRTGGNVGTSLKAAIGASLVVFFVVLSLMSFLPN